MKSEVGRDRVGSFAPFYSGSPVFTSQVRYRLLGLHFPVGRGKSQKWVFASQHYSAELRVRSHECRHEFYDGQIGNQNEHKFFSDNHGSVAVNFYSTIAPSSGLIRQDHKRPKYSLTKPKVSEKNFTFFLSLAM
jgi:hypothetical protein